MHRAQHAVPFLWRMHATHHSIRELTAWTALVSPTQADPFRI
ncbi:MULTISPECIES: hypothetical protein [unclassified Mesorhizobium]